MHATTAQVLTSLINPTARQSLTCFEMAIKDNTATTQFKVDRTLYNIKYGSASFFDNLKDKAIDNEFDLDVTLKF